MASKTLTTTACAYSRSAAKQKLRPSPFFGVDPNYRRPGRSSALNQVQPLFSLIGETLPIERGLLFGSMEPLEFLRSGSDLRWRYKRPIVAAEGNNAELVGCFEREFSDALHENQADAHNNYQSCFGRGLNFLLNLLYAKTILLRRYSKMILLLRRNILAKSI